MRTYSGHSTARASNELYRTNLAKGQTGLSIAFDLPTQTGYDPDAPEAAGEVGKVGRPRGPPGPHARAARGHPRGDDEHLHDDQRHRGVAARALRGPRAGPGRRPGAAGGHDAERHRQGVPEPGDLHLPARAEPAAHRRHHRLHGAPGAQVEPDQRLQLPPPRGGRDAGAGDRLRAGHRHRRARRRARLGQDRAESELPAVVGRISFFVNSSVRFVEETCKMRAFTRCGTASAASATASRTPSCAASATACRSTRSG